MLHKMNNREQGHRHEVTVARVFHTVLGLLTCTIYFCHKQTTVRVQLSDMKENQHCPLHLCVD